MLETGIGSGSVVRVFNAEDGIFERRAGGMAIKHDGQEEGTEACHTGLAGMRRKGMQRARGLHAFDESLARTVAKDGRRFGRSNIFCQGHK
jgi:hypothetical protein